MAQEQHNLHPQHTDKDMRIANLGNSSTIGLQTNV
jgi:hypothetical protein